MAGDTEATRESGVGIELAPLQFEDFAAAIAAEVMMMGLAGDLIPKSFARHGDRREPVTLQQ